MVTGGICLSPTRFKLHTNAHRIHRKQCLHIAHIGRDAEDKSQYMYAFHVILNKTLTSVLLKRCAGTTSTTGDGKSIRAEIFRIMTISRADCHIWKWDRHQEFSKQFSLDTVLWKFILFDFDMGVQFYLFHLAIFWQDIFITWIQLMI